MSVPTFTNLQRKFAAHMRDPEHCPAPTGIEPRRVQVYRDLIYNNVRSFMRKGFPVLVKVLGADRFDRLVRDWLSEHRASTPLFPRMPGEFVRWLNTRPNAADDFPPWLRDLAHYEWVELDLSLAEDVVATDGSRLQLSPLARVLRYEWPVQMIGPETIPTTPTPTTLLVYRDAADTVRFLVTTPMTHALLSTVKDQGPIEFAELLAHLGDVDALAAPAQVLLDDLLDRGVVRKVQ